MIRRLLFLGFIFYTSITSAQKGKSYPVKVGEIPDKVLPYEAIYILPAFKTGTALQRDGSSTTLPFNYNLLLDEMHFIGVAGDTLAIADPLLLSYVVIDSMVFYYDKGYIRQVLKQGLYKVGVRQQMVQIADKTRGGYDVASGSTAIKTYGYVNSNNSQIYRLQVRKDVLFQEEHSFYIADASNHFLRANKKNFYHFFSPPAVRKYLDAHKVNFNSEEDLKSLLRYCAE